MKKIGLRWIVGTLVILLVAGGMVRLGFWQLDRLDERKAQNRTVVAALKAPPTPLADIGIPSDLGEYRKVQLSGVWQPTTRVLLRYPIRDGQQGYEVLEALKLDSGGLVVVNRGWVTQDAGQAMVAMSDRNAGSRVDIEGYLRNSQSTSDEIGTNGASPALSTITEVDVPRLAPLMGAETTRLAPMWVQLSQPAQQDDPLPVPTPEITEGSHFSYALQWFSFAAIAVIGWIALLVRNRRDQVVRNRRDQTQ